jgi:anti-sigma B factor antagonist
MSLAISQKENEGIVILELKGELTVGEGASALRETLSTLAEAGKTRVVVNMEKVEYMDSTGLGSLVICFTTLKKAGGMLKLLNLNKRNIELLILTKLVSVFELFNDEKDAVNSFFPDRRIQQFDILSFVQEQKER